MKKIGGIFPLEETLQQENSLFARLCPLDGDLRFLMSGRCGIYYALEDIKLTDHRRVAYLPRYTCETVAAPFAKAGYTLRFYDFTRDMMPIFEESALDEISVISICGYYGFCNYDRAFVEKCKRRGIIVIEDVTHSVLSSDGVDPNCDYVAGSLRKWMGVTCGGFAVKTSGRFSCDPKPVEEKHLAARQKAIEEKSYDAFWDAEMYLREIFDMYAGDKQSEYIMRHFDCDKVCRIRKNNYEYILNHLPKSHKFRPVFPILPTETVPSHFTIFIEEREKAQEFLKNLGIGSTVYWPKGPLVSLEGHDSTAYIYEHVLSLPCDQRFSFDDMQRICDALEGLGQIN